MAILLLSAIAFANPYPTTLDNGNLVLVDGGMGVGRYAARSSVAVEQYAPPNYQIAISLVSVTFSDEYWRQHDTYVGGPYRMGESFLLRFRYNLPVFQGFILETRLDSLIPLINKDF